MEELTSDDAPMACVRTIRRHGINRPTGDGYIRHVGSNSDTASDSGRVSPGGGGGGYGGVHTAVESSSQYRLL